MSAVRALVGVFAVVQLLGGCGPASEAPDVPVVSVPVVPEEVRDDYGVGSLRAAVAESLRFLDAVPGERVLGEWPRRVTAEEVRSSLTEFLGLVNQPAGSGEGWPHRVAERFDFFPAPFSTTLGDVLFTGYYQPVIDASPVETADYRYPVYREPDELRTRRARGSGGPDTPATTSTSWGASKARVTRSPGSGIRWIASSCTSRARGCCG